MKIIVINGPNINMLGIREPDIYGRESYEDLKKLVKDYCDDNDIELEIYQSNHEGCLVDKIQEAYFNKADGIVINPGAYTHTSIAIMDAIKAVKLPTVEVHISKLDEREDFRQVSYIGRVAIKTVIGEGIEGYVTAIKEICSYKGEK
ncbi:MAG: type II 3-dehydroquinate dehydratase [Lachnospiraceae bacterium]|nr:type II 3-dehydroquinate dehydratase [Lachnospiraceae bacterium]